MDHNYFFYILTNKKNNVLYTGMSNDLIRRVSEHKDKLIDGFTKKYNCTKLVWYEIHDNPCSAISKEKKLKAGSRKKKLDLITGSNPEWRDLFNEIL